MSDTVIKIENLSKQYRLGTVGTGTLSHDLNRWWARVLGKDDPTLAVTESNDRAHSGKSDFVWALKDINLEVKKGDILGIIGRNGAGKSTLLKILSRVTAPTTGSIKVKGRIASLLEVGTGFHPELTGRENIYLNGAILGMTRKEVTNKLDEIIDFSGCERFIDTPVKRYSSGMMVRLGFAVAAHLEPEILVIDEVLAVGDVDFQKKCIGKMGDVAKSGRTIIFVSHNMAAVEGICNACIYLDNGELKTEGHVGDVIQRYLEVANGDDEIRVMEDDSRQGFMFTIQNPLGLVIKAGEDVCLDFAIHCPKPIRDVTSGILILDGLGRSICGMSSKFQGIQGNGAGTEWMVSCRIEKISLTPGDYNLRFYLGEVDRDVAVFSKGPQLTVRNNPKLFTVPSGPPHSWGPFYYQPDWTITLDD